MSTLPQVQMNGFNIELYYIIIVFLAAFIGTYASVPLCKKIGHILGAIDYQSKRRINTVPVPRCGGIALFFGLHVGFLAYFIGVEYFHWHFDDLYNLAMTNWALLYIGIVIIFCVGLVDDIVQLNAAAKLLGQIAGVVLVYFSGASIGSMNLFGTDTVVSFGWLDFPITVIYLIAFINITNLIDGIDGLCAGIIAILAITFSYLMFERSSFTMVFVCTALFAVCLSFLRYNFFPASIFMGDSGSNLLGLLIGIISILGVVRAQTAIFFLVPIIFAIIPVFDTCQSIVRRLKRNQPVMEGDLEHIHHKLLKRGLSQKRTVAVLWLSTALFCIVGYAISNSHLIVTIVVTIVASILLFALLYKLGIFEPVLAHLYKSDDNSASYAAPTQDSKE